MLKEKENTCSSSTPNRITEIDKVEYRKKFADILAWWTEENLKISNRRVVLKVFDGEEKIEAFSSTKDFFSCYVVKNDAYIGKLTWKDVLEKYNVDIGRYNISIDFWSKKCNHTN